tara:strand:- start:171 stop:443 length:273 start_codon:yes stop_codon:yes gene_type:complete
MSNSFMQNHQSALDSFMEDKAIQDLEDAGIYPVPDNDAVLENLFEDALEEVTRKNKYQFPPCTEEELNSTASELAKQWLEELPEPGDYDD